MTKRTNYYVDGFNLFHRCLEHGPNRWLDLAALFRRMLPSNEISRIRYFTSWVSGSGDPDRPVRQQQYIRALRTLPNLSVHFGEFHRNAVRRPLTRPIPGYSNPTVEVWDMKEKGSDVSLASWLLLDAHRHEFDVAVVVSNDSDLMLPIKFVVTEFARPVGVLDPSDRTSKSLSSVATFYHRIHKGDLAKSQFPRQLADADGPICRPPSWDAPAPSD
jgi:hypothetical protein